AASRAGKYFALRPRLPQLSILFRKGSRCQTKYLSISHGFFWPFLNSLSPEIPSIKEAPLPCALLYMRSPLGLRPECFLFRWAGREAGRYARPDRRAEIPRYP